MAGASFPHDRVLNSVWNNRAFSLAGTIMVTYGDAKQGDSTQLNTVGGDLLVLLSGLCYAAYTVRPLPDTAFSIGTFFLHFTVLCMEAHEQ